ncbi:MAG: tetratricopeptide repeat protein, partial [Deltaproteobacteria bacterium]|nr:tetratricopeptide repeat protein [Deltaproteobacteria bacterium]
IEQAEREPDPPLALITHEKGLLARERGQAEDALNLLQQAADADPLSTARVDHAGVLVHLGRWPEAVAVLARALEERGAGLRIDELVVDARFVKLSEFPPFKRLVEDARAEQAGPFGKLMLKLERIDKSARVAMGILERISLVLNLVWRLASAVGAPVVALILLGLLVTFGVGQLGLLKPPWTLGVGMALASMLWHWGARVATADASGGRQTIGVALAIVFGPWALVMLVRQGLRSWKRRRGVSADRSAA